MERTTPPVETLPQGRQPTPSKPTTGTATVTVGCKMPNGIIMRLFEMQPGQEPMFGGGFRDVSVAYQVGKTYVLRGNSLDQASIRRGKLPDFPPIAGTALTHGIPREFWEEWKHQNADLPALVNGLIFAHEDSNQVADQAREKRDLMSGYEPIDPEAPMKKTGMRGVTSYTTVDEQV